jgi:uncharacterized protein (TIGR03086 family)
VTFRDGLRALGRAQAAFEQRLCLVEVDDWPRPTPCSEWDVHALVNHVVGGNRRYAMLLHGASAEAVQRTRTEDHLGANPSAAFTTTAIELAATFREDGALTRVAHHPIGDRTGAELLAMRVLDLAVHAWDLAHALDVDDTLDPDAVEYALAHVEVIEVGRKHGSFAVPADPSPAIASGQAILLHLAGRPIEGDHW